MIADRTIHNAAIKVVNKYGVKHDPVALDPFIESACTYKDNILDITVLKRLGDKSDGEVVSIMHSTIKTTGFVGFQEWGPGDGEFFEPQHGEEEVDYLEEEDYDAEEDDEEWEDEEIELEELVVFDYVSVNDLTGGAYSYIPGPWMNKLQEMYESLEVESNGSSDIPN